MLKEKTFSELYQRLPSPLSSTQRNWPELFRQGKFGYNATLNLLRSAGVDPETVRLRENEEGEWEFYLQQPRREKTPPRPNPKPNR